MRALQKLAGLPEILFRRPRSDWSDWSAMSTVGSPVPGSELYECDSCHPQQLADDFNRVFDDAVPTAMLSPPPASLVTSPALGIVVAPASSDAPERSRKRRKGEICRFALRALFNGPHITGQSSASRALDDHWVSTTGDLGTAIRNNGSHDCSSSK